MLYEVKNQSGAVIAVFDDIEDALLFAASKPGTSVRQAGLNESAQLDLPQFLTE